MLSSALLFCLVFIGASGEPDPNVNVKIDVDVKGRKPDGSEEAPDLPIGRKGCPEDQGFFRTPHPYNQCFKHFHKLEASWYTAYNTCQEAGLVLARPMEMIDLRSYLVLSYGPQLQSWLDGMSNDEGTCVKWNRGPYGCISADIPLWGYPGQPDVRIGNCLMLLSNANNWGEHPEKPLYSYPCSEGGRYPLCELLM